MISIEQIDSVLQHSGSVMDQKGDRVGHVEQVFVGDESGQPEWVTVKTGLFGHSETFIPLREASMDGDDIRVPYEKSRIKDAPRTAGSAAHVEPEQEAELYRYYGLESDAGLQERWNDGGAAAGAAGPHDDGGAEIPGRDAEQAPPDAGHSPSREAVGGTSSGGGGQHVKREDADPEVRHSQDVRLRKYTVTEHVTMTVPVEREHVEVVPDDAVRDDEGDAQAAGQEDPYNSESHGRHPEQG